VFVAVAVVVESWALPWRLLKSTHIVEKKMLLTPEKWKKGKKSVIESRTVVEV